MMGKEEYSETYIHHDQEYITVHRVNPHTRKGIFLIAHTAFPGYGNGNGGFGETKLPGTSAKLIGAFNLEVDNSPETRARKSLGGHCRSEHVLTATVSRDYGRQNHSSWLA
jgi:glycogen debranching enzyme